MSVFDEAVLEVAKGVLAGDASALPKSAFYSAIQKRADAICKDARRSAEGRFADCAVNDPVGRTLFAAMRKASGPEVLENDSATADRPESKPFVGAAGKRMQALADLHHARNPQNSAAGSYALVFRANPKLGEQVKAEHLNASVAKMYG
jgi:hypothetical protein